MVHLLGTGLRRGIAMEMKAALLLCSGKAGKSLALAIEQVLQMENLFAFGEILDLEVCYFCLVYRMKLKIDFFLLIFY